MNVSKVVGDLLKNKIHYSIVGENIMFNKFRKIAITNRLEDQILYEYVLDELEDGIKVKGLWAKAYANSEGNSDKVEPLYMQYRAQSIKDIFTAMKIAYQELSKDKIISYLNQSSENITKINVNNKEVNSFSVNKKSDFDKANEEKCQNICKYSYNATTYPKS